VQHTLSWYEIHIPYEYEFEENEDIQGIFLYHSHLLFLRTFCKGQFIASSPTIFPKEYVLEFQKCLDKTEPLEWSVIKNVIEKELGGPISRYFDSVGSSFLYIFETFFLTTHVLRHLHYLILCCCFSCLVR